MLVLVDCKEDKPCLASGRGQAQILGLSRQFSAWLTCLTSLVDVKHSPEFPCQRYQHSTQWPVTEAPASVADYFVAQTRVLRLPLDNLIASSFPFLMWGGGVCGSD